jgi:hypothetical protein
MSRLAEIQEEIRAGRAVVANIKDKESVQWAKSQGVFVFIGRCKVKGDVVESEWGMPYGPWQPLNDAQRNRVCDCHRLWLKSQTGLLEKIPDLCGKVLFCYCYPLPCHGDELVRRAKNIHRQRKRGEPDAEAIENELRRRLEDSPL